MYCHNECHNEVSHWSNLVPADSCLRFRYLVDMATRRRSMSSLHMARSVFNLLVACKQFEFPSSLLRGTGKGLLGKGAAGNEVACKVDNERVVWRGATLNTKEVSSVSGVGLSSPREIGVGSSGETGDEGLDCSS